jgi:hypothetical protein
MASPVWAAVDSSDFDRATSQTCPKPTGVVEDDLMIAGVAIADANTDTVTVPTGWNLISDSSGVNQSRVLTYWLVAGDSEPTDYTWSWTANTMSGITIGRITGADTTTPVEGNGTPADGTTGDANPPSHTPGSSQDYLVIAVAAVSWKGLTFTPPVNYDEESDEGTGGPGNNTVHIGQSFVSRELTTGSAEDPGDIVPSIQGDWSAQTIFIQPPAAAPAAAFPPFPRRQLTTVRM